MRHQIKLWKETTWGVFPAPTTPVKNTDYIVPRLSTANPYTVRRKPKRWGPIRTFAQNNRRVLTGAQQWEISGAINFDLYPEQAAFVFSSMILPAGSPEVLPSVTIDHMIQMEDAAGTVIYQRYLGVRVASATIGATAEQPIFRVQLQVLAQAPPATAIAAADFPDPPATDFPAGNPYLFQNMAAPGYLKLLGTDREPEHASFELSIENHLDATYNANAYPSRLKFCGRDVSWKDKIMFLTAGDRAAFEAVTTGACSAEINNGTHSVLLNFNAQNFAEQVDDDLQLDHAFYQEIAWRNQYDPAALSDLTVTVS